MVNYGYFAFDNHYSTDENFGFILSRPVDISNPKRRTTTERIPGRNGDLVLWDGTYENRTAECRGYIMADGGGSVLDKMNSISRFLSLESPEYKRFFTKAMYETGENERSFFLARCTEGLNIKTVKNGLAEASIKFDLMPQRYFLSGYTSVQYSADDWGTDGALYFSNPSNFKAFPRISFRFNWSQTNSPSSLSVRVNDRTVLAFVRDTSYAETISKTVVFDTETNTVTETPEGLSVQFNNSKLAAFDRGVMNEDENVIKFSNTSMLSYVTIVPRWWTL